jgi:PTH1 family peptidyl-tRNA hydrolase
MTYPKKLIVGLGNPGKKYFKTRHNVGFDWVDNLVLNKNVEFKEFSKFKSNIAKIDFIFGSVFILKPLTFMNNSGSSVSLFVNYYNIELDDIIIVHDELDLKPGSIVFKSGKGHGGHNGLRSVINHLGDKSFDRLRVGIGHPGEKSLVSDYVLSKPNNSDEKLIHNVVCSSLDKINLLLTGPIDIVMNEINRR